MPTFPFRRRILPSMSNTTTKGINAIPAPTSTKALTFNGKTSGLFELFKYLEDLAAECSLSTADKCKMIIRYVDGTTKRFWVTLTGLESHDLTFSRSAFSVSIHWQVPKRGSNILVVIVAAPGNDDITSETELLHYHRKFQPVVVWLVADKKILPPRARQGENYLRQFDARLTEGWN